MVISNEMLQAILAALLALLAAIQKLIELAHAGA